MLRVDGALGGAMDTATLDADAGGLRLSGRVVFGADRQRNLACLRLDGERLWDRDIRRLPERLCARLHPPHGPWAQRDNAHGLQRAALDGWPDSWGEFVELVDTRAVPFGSMLCTDPDRGVLETETGRRQTN